MLVRCQNDDSQQFSATVIQFNHLNLERLEFGLETNPTEFWASDLRHNKVGFKRSKS
jgi:hypothetical protein